MCDLLYQACRFVGVAALPTCCRVHVGGAEHDARCLTRSYGIVAFIPCPVFVAPAAHSMELAVRPVL